MTESSLRIGELSRRTDVPPELLRAWERRYGLLAPARTSGHFRLYSEADVARVLRMRAYIDEGLSASEAARAALADPSRPAATGAPDGAATDLAQALERFDDAGAQTALDTLLAGLSLEGVVRDVLIPYLHDVGERWERGQLSVGQEHFISNVLRGRLLALARGWDRGWGSRVVLASAQGDQHDLPALLYGTLLRTYGSRITFLGANTPVRSLVEAARDLPADAVVVSGTVEGVFEPLVDDLRRVSEHARLYLAGPASSDDLARRAEASHLDADLVEAARIVAETATRTRA